MLEKNDNEKSQEEIIQSYFIEHGLTLSVAESCTGGAIAARLTKIAGASNYFLGGIVSYSNSMKEKLLGVPRSTLDTKGAVCEETATAMVLGVIRATGSDVGIAVTGVAGPAGGSKDKPVGTVWIAIAKKGEIPLCNRYNFNGDRITIIEQSVRKVLEMIEGLI